MWTIIEQLVQGIVTGVVGPVFTYLGKKQDTTLAGFQTATGADQASYQAWLNYQVQITAQKAAANNWWGPRLLYMIVGGSAAFHFAAVMLDSVPFWYVLGSHVVGSWGVPKLPTPYDTYEGWVVASLFVVSLASGPVSAATAWLHRK